MQTPEAGVSAALRIGFVPGVSLGKWRQRWVERFPRLALELIEVTEDAQRTALEAGEIDACFVRLPIASEKLHLIRLYDEVSVAWVFKDHAIAAVDELTLTELADETVLKVLTKENLDLVGAGHAVLQVPQSIARAHSRRDFTYRPITDAPATTVGLAWLVNNDQELIQEFVGVVRGRTANSSRSAQPRATEQPAKKAASPAKTKSRQPKSTSAGRGQRRRHR